MEASRHPLPYSPERAPRPTSASMMSSHDACCVNDNPFRFSDNVVDRVPALQHAITCNPAFDGDSILLQEAVRRWRCTAAVLHMFCIDLSACCVSAPLVVVHNPSCRYALWVCALPGIVHDAFSTASATRTLCVPCPS